MGEFCLNSSFVHVILSSFCRFVYWSQKIHLVHSLLLRIPLLPLLQFTCFILLTSPLVKLSHDPPTNLYSQELKEMNQVLYHILRSYILPCLRDMLLYFILCSRFQIFLPVCVFESWVMVFVFNILFTRFCKWYFASVSPSRTPFPILSHQLSTIVSVHWNREKNTLHAVSFSIVLPSVLQVIFCSSAIYKASPSFLSLTNVSIGNGLKMLTRSVIYYCSLLFVIIY